MQRPIAQSCHSKKRLMKITAATFVIACTLLITGCFKDPVVTGSEFELYGKWAKGPNAGDTLDFLQKNNQNIMRHLESYNSGVPVYSETQYMFNDGKPSLKNLTAGYHPVTSFIWNQAGAEFQVLGIDLFSYISSTTTIFTYRKI